MPATRRKNLLVSRRRRQEDGEEDDSVAGDLQDDSMSEGSALSNGDDDDPEAEGSNSSGDEHEPVNTFSKTTKSLEQPAEEENKHVPKVLDSQTSTGPLEPNAAADALPHGVAAVPKLSEPEDLHFEDLAISQEEGATTANEAMVPRAPRHETASQRSRREHQEYIKQRDANPAFVPTRGGFFLHDDRNSRPSGPNPRPFGRGRGRGVAAPTHIAGYVRTNRV